jgi:predicted transcriptional regulator
MTTQDTSDQVMASFQLPMSDYRRLTEIAATDERSVSAVLRLAVRDYLKKKAA